MELKAKLKRINKMVVTKIVGIILIGIGTYLFKLGCSYDDSDTYNLMNIRLIGIAVLCIIGGIAILLSSKTFGEIFVVL